MNSVAEAASSILSKPVIELSSYRVVRNGGPSEEAILAYERDGVVCLKEAFPPEWVDEVRRGMEISQASPDPTYAHDITTRDDAGRFFIDHFMWRRIDCFERFFRESPVPDLAMDLMRRGQR